MIHFSRFQFWLIVVVCTLGVLMALPNFVSRSIIDQVPDFVPAKTVNLGLDLRGGSHVLLEVGVQEVVKRRLQTIVSDVRKSMIGAKPRIGYTGLGVRGNTVTFTVRKDDDVSRARAALRTNMSDTSITTSGNRVTIEFTELAKRALNDSAMAQTIEIIRKRIDETGTREPTIQRQGADRIIIELPGVDNPQRILDLIGKTAALSFHLMCPTITQQGADGPVPPGCVRYETSDARDTTLSYIVSKRQEVNGENLVDAQGTFQENRPVVSFRFDTVGARKFCRITRGNIQKPFAIVLDKKVISAPVIQSAICGGSGIITGNFTVQTAKDLALLLRAGALPAPIQPLEQRAVGASMGADSIRAGKIASVGAIVLVIVAMAVFYGRFGLMADVALVVNMILILGALSVLQATLTLPGIAGIVLTMGMAVDANVLIFERIREEQRNGRTPISAVDAGYQRALGTIIDANVTTFLAALLLFSFGSGPVKGFAVTLMIGLATSMFTAIMITRLLVVLWLRRRRPERLPL